MPDGTPKKKTPLELDSLCRAYTEAMVKKLGGYAVAADDADIEPDIRLRAIGMLLDRGWGKAIQKQDTTAKVEGELRVTIRKLLGDVDE